MATEFYLPKMSDHMEKGTIIKWLVNEGDEVEERQPILEIETDKVVAEVEAPASGTLRGVRAGAGVEVPVGETVAFIAQPGEEIPELPPIALDEQVERKGASVSETSSPSEQSSDSGRSTRAQGADFATVQGAGSGGRITKADVQKEAEGREVPRSPAPHKGRILASPAARKLAREQGIDLSSITGTEPGERISKQDVVRYTEALAAKSTELEAARSSAAAEAAEWLELSTIRRVTGERLTRSWQTVPHFTLTMEVDMSEAGRLRETLMERIVAATGHRLSYTGVVVKVVACALRQHPLANAEFADGGIRLHRQINVGVAAAVQGGLLVPVIRSADELGLAEITGHLREFQEKAASMSFTPDDLAGGTFTLSNLGMFGVDQFTAIINPPQSAILALGRIAQRLVVVPGGGAGVRPIMSMTLSVDHRVLDGVDGARFLLEVKGLLENPCGLL